MNLQKTNGKWGQTNSFYYTSKWRETSRKYRNQNPLCEICHENGFINESTQTDHIIPIEHGGDKLNYSNLQALCDICHARKTQMDKKKYGRK